ncbi:MAG: GPP34 family phosphoprotein [Microbacterium sp.]
MLIAERLHLLLTRPDGTDERGVQARRAAAAAALVADLIAAGRVKLSKTQPTTVRVVSTDETGNFVLDRGLEWIAKRDGAPLASVVTWSRLNPTPAVVDSLLEMGTITLGRRRLFVAGRRRTPHVDPAPERKARKRLSQVLRGKKKAKFDDIALLAILRGLSVIRHILRDDEGERLSNDLRERADAIVAGSRVGSALSSAVREASITLSTVSVVPAAIVTDPGAQS